MAVAKERLVEVPRGRPPLHAVWLPIMALYTPVHIFCFVVVSSFLLLPAHYAAAFWVGGLVLYYILTSQGYPQHTGRPLPPLLQHLSAQLCHRHKAETSRLALVSVSKLCMGSRSSSRRLLRLPGAAGCREWPWLQEWLRLHLGAALRAWFGSVQVVYEGSKPVPPGLKYVLGYHPHGLFPIGALAQLTPSVFCTTTPAHRPAFQIADDSLPSADKRTIWGLQDPMSKAMFAGD